jgi:oligopeptide transport system substrate-binding protein
MVVKFNYKKLALISIILIINISCSKTNSNNKNTLLIDVGSEPPVLDTTLSEDTSSSRIMYDLFAGLLDFDQTNQLKPGLAQKWDISADGKTYKFYLRNDIKFSDGVAITANDFVYSWQRLVDPKTTSPYNFLISGVVNATEIIEGKLPANKLGVIALSKNIFQVNLTHPDSSFLYHTILPNAFVVPKHVIDKYGKSWTQPEHIVTSGAYTLKEHVVNGYELAQKNPYFYDKDNVKIEQVKYLPYSEKNATISNYRANTLDITFQSVPVDQYGILKNEFANQMHNVLQEAIYYYDFNMKNPIFANNLPLRQALSMAINREQLTNNVLKMDQKPLYSIVTSTINDGLYKDIKYSWANWDNNKKLAEARKLFKEAGYSDTNPLELSISYNTDDLHKRVALTIMSMWQNVFGKAIKISVENSEWKTFLQKRHKGDYLIARDGWVADYNDVSTYTPLYLCGSEQNNSHYCNNTVNSLVTKAVNDIKSDDMVRPYKEALNIALNDYQIIPIFQYTYQQMVKPRVLDYNPDENHLLHVQTKWMRLKND